MSLSQIAGATIRNMQKPLNLSACLAGHHDTELNAALCEWLGWKRHPNEDWKRLNVSPWFDPQGRFHDTPPSHIRGMEALGNYLEACKRLTDEQFTTHLHELWKLLGRPLHRDMSPTRDLWESPNRHRVIAILQTVKPEMFVP